LIPVIPIKNLSVGANRLLFMGHFDGFACLLQTFHHANQHMYFNTEQRVSQWFIYYNTAYTSFQHVCLYFDPIGDRLSPQSVSYRYEFLRVYQIGVMFKKFIYDISLYLASQTRARVSCAFWIIGFFPRSPTKRGDNYRRHLFRDNRKGK